MSGITIRKGRYTEKFVTLPNTLAQDRNLSFEARGLLAYLLSKPENWEIRETDLKNEGTCGSHRVRRILKELIAANYIIKKRDRDPDGTFTKVIFEVFPEPQTPGKPSTCQKSTVDNPPVKKQLHTKERTLQNTDLTKTADGGYFDDFWMVVPKKVGKGAARTAFAKAIKKADPKTIVKAMYRYSKETETIDQKYVPHPETWLNGERWIDEPPRRRRLTQGQIAG